MTFDGITTRAVVTELQEKLVGGQVNRINQIGKHEITLQIYAKGVLQQLFISTQSSRPSFYLSDRKYANPIVAPQFVMLLRKHLNRSRILAIQQRGLDRTVRIIFEGRSELGDTVEKSLMLEIMGRQSNLILLDANDKILECITRVSANMSRTRQLYPGIRYEVFPSKKRDPLKDDIELTDLINIEKQSAIFKAFYQNITGFSPAVSREICFRSDVDPELSQHLLSEQEILRLDQTLQKLIERIRSKTFEPALYTKDFREFYAFPLYHRARPDMTDPSMSHLIDTHYEKAPLEARLSAKKSNMITLMKNAIEKEDRKLQKMQKEYAETQNEDIFRKEADLLSPIVHTLQKGQEMVEVEDYYDNNKKRIITLNPKLNGWENVSAKYKKATKLKTAKKLLAKNIPVIEQNILYYNQLLLTLEESDSTDILSDIEEELTKEGLLKKKRKNAKKDQKRSVPLKFILPSGTILFVGKNNRQNDELTLKRAGKEDYFFHARKIPGAHVIVKTGDREITEEEILAAGYLAAIHSANKNEHAVDIDYTKRKNVYKAKGAKPGMVYYNDFHTVRIDTSKRPKMKEETNG